MEIQAEGSFVIAEEQLHVLLYSAVREMLFNIVKHAQASRAGARTNAVLRVPIPEKRLDPVFNLLKTPVRQWHIQRPIV